MTGSSVARHTVTGVIAGMIVATAAATIVGFWLSYAGLHDFAFRAGLSGPEGWAWPASVDLFIAAGEAGVTVSALRHRQDKAAWLYLGLGFAASVTANVLHVDTAALHWTRYAVAAVPPVAAMLALAALLRQVYRLAGPRAPEAHPAPVPGTAPEADASAHPESTTSAPSARTRSAPARRTRAPQPSAPGRRTRSAPVTPDDAEREFMPELASGALPSVRQVRARLHIGQDRAKQIRAHLESVTTRI